MNDRGSKLDITPEVVIMIIALVALVGAAFLYTKRSDTDYGKFINKMDVQAGEVKDIKEQIEVLSKTMQAINEKRIEADKTRDSEIEGLKKTNSVAFTPIVNVKFPDGFPPVKVLLRQVQPKPQAQPSGVNLPPGIPQPPANLKKTPLLDKAGLTKQGKHQ